jgi:signal transduction histidine kinase/ligand-binding sensor domain-containing protein/DNA-binding response OmpR family regulator
MLQDRDGYLWIGTWSGLLRYDGYSTKIFKSDDSQPFALKSNKITSLLEDSHGFLWVGTRNGGLFRYDKAEDKFYQYKHNPAKSGSLSNNNISSLLEDRHGNIWIGTEKGLNLYDRKAKAFRKFFNDPADPNSIQFDFITTLHQSASGKIWVATGIGISSLESSDAALQQYKIKNYRYEQDIAHAEQHNYIIEIGETAAAGKEVLWFATIKGLKKFTDGQFQNFEAADKTSGANFFQSLLIVPGESPYILLGSSEGLLFFDPVQEVFTRSLGNNDPELNLSHNEVSALYLDYSKVLWVGTKKGINKFDTYSRSFELYQLEEYDQSKSVISGIRAAAGGGYWVGTHGGGLYKFNPAQKSADGKPVFTKYSLLDQKDNSFTEAIQTLYTDAENNVWIGTGGAGLYVFNENSIQPVSQQIRPRAVYSLSTPQQLSDNHVMSFAEDRTGGMWVGTWSGGLNKITKEGEVLRFPHPAFVQVPLIVMHSDSAGDLWVGTRGSGLYRIRKKGDGLDIKVYQQQHGLTNNFIEAIYEDSLGRLWLGTEGGLFSFDKKEESFTFHKLRDDGEKLAVVGILEDSAGSMWLSHWNGITVFDPNDPAPAIRDYDTQDRVQGGFFYSNVCFKNKDGKLVFGGGNGLNIIDPVGIISHPVLPKIQIENFQIFNKAVEIGEEFNGRVILTKPISVVKPNEIVLKHSENSVSFEFTALHFAAPEKIEYAYRLAGFDEEWRFTDASRRYVSYTNLPSGTYNFQVKATNNDGVWGEQLVQFPFTVSPPWWQTAWAFLLYVVAVVAILYLFRYLIIMRTNFINNLRIERVKRENLEVLSKTKLEFFTNVSHEFRTPLTLIAGPLHTVLESGEGNKFVRQQLMVVNNNTQRLLRLVNQLLDFRKIEAGNLGLQAAEGNIVHFVEEIKLSFETLAEERQIDFSFRASSADIRLWFDRDQFEKILYNLLSNAFKNTPKGGSISLEVQQDAGEVSISIADTGRGIDAKNYENIFKRFYTYYEPSKEKNNGTGIGLALTKSLVELHRGTINVESKKGEFTRFTICLQKGNAHLQPSEIAEDYKDSEHIDTYPKPSFVESVMLNLTEGLPENDLTELPRILIVEDNAEVRAYIKSVFIGKYQILEAEDGKEGLCMAQEKLPDLIISDVMMPVMDGITLCRKIKSKLKTSHIPVILLTARTSLIFKVEGLETGADDYITKPFDAKILTLKVNNIIKLRETMRRMFQDSKVLNIEPNKVTITAADEIFIKKALESVEENMANSEYSVEDLEREVGQSRMQLYRKLKSLTGQSANEFIRTIRLKRAAQLIAQNQLTIAEVTYQVGFVDLPYFRKCFKKQFGVNPSEYAGSAANNAIPE